MNNELTYFVKYSIHKVKKLHKGLYKLLIIEKLWLIFLWKFRFDNNEQTYFASSGLLYKQRDPWWENLISVHNWRVFFEKFSAHQTYIPPSQVLSRIKVFDWNLSVQRNGGWCLLKSFRWKYWSVEKIKFPFAMKIVQISFGFYVSLKTNN